MPSLPRRLIALWALEKPLLSLGGLAAIATVGVWFFLYRWNGADLLATNDALHLQLPLLLELQRRAFDVESLLYTPALLGGTRVSEAGLFYPLLMLLGRLGLAPVVAMNLFLLCGQITLGFFGAQASWLLARQRMPGVIGRLGLVWVFAFLPAAGWRLTAWHPNLVLGVLAFLVLLVWYLEAHRGRVSLINLLVGSLALCNALPTVTGQTLYYSALVLMGLAPFLFRSYPLRRQEIALLASLLGCLALACGGDIQALWNFASSPDTARSGAGTVVYSYTLQTVRDLLAGFSFNPHWGLLSHARSSWHEFYVPLGAWVCFVPVLFYKNTRTLGLVFAIAFVLLVAASIKLEPVASLLVRALPLFSAFRCPHRAQLLLATLLPLWGMRCLLTTPQPDNAAAGLRWAFLILVFLVGARALPSTTRDVIVTVALLSGIFAWYFFPAKLSVFSREVLLLLAGAAHVVGFQHAVNFGPEQQALSAALVPLSEARNETLPLTQSPLTRVAGQSLGAPLGANTAFAVGLSSLDGYWYPPSRLLNLVGALENRAVDPMSQTLLISPRSHLYPVLRQLYNIKYTIGESAPQSPRLKLIPDGYTIGPAWFSTKLAPVQNWTDLAQKLVAAKANLALLLARELTFVVSDPHFAKHAMPPLTSDKCDDAKVTGISTARGGQEIRVNVYTLAQCPLTIAQNFASNLHAYTETRTGARLALGVFPAWGSLLGISVPAGTSQVVVQAKPAASGTLRFLCYIGIAGLLFLFSWLLFWIPLRSTSP